MAIRFDSEEELRKLGFRPLKKDLWIPNLPNGNSRKITKSKSDVRGKTERADRKEDEIKRGVRYRIHFTAYRKRLLDWLNLSAGFKIYEDKLVEKGIIPDDCPSLVDPPVVTQIKCKKGEKEKVIIEVYQYDSKKVSPDECRRNWLNGPGLQKRSK